MAHEPGVINWDDIHFQKTPGSYSKFKAYSQSKLANVMHAAELARRVENLGIKVYSLHPGKLYSVFGHDITNLILYFGIILYSTYDN